MQFTTDIKKRLQGIILDRRGSVVVRENSQIISTRQLLLKLCQECVWRLF